ncbi:Uncharacterised protein [Serratia ficaria]|uniref:STY1053 family phage-associated protein n=1 Tax=Serratia ficaria TaxID=61651 RepID=UPI0021793972|nr:hypothetical protein [Serratia ficaria]CAI1017517.1 Uncharacterised protein [Serratia ficaria]CAI2033216.1 Uncharacterised protein [Serratia ficaria]CAI2540316.1 Uncharacterised protein [Serratia ficaria]CAI2794327.1 Uncharacterised protein [Serratia ficaria]
MTKEKLVSIHVHTPFKLTLSDNSVQEFGKGRHNVPEAVATHWFVEAHTESLGDYTAPDIDEAGAQRITELEILVEKLNAQVEEQNEQLQAAAAGLVERNDQIAELNAQVEELTARLEKTNGAAKK